MKSPSNPKNSDDPLPTTQNGQSNNHTNSSINDIPPSYGRQITHSAEIKNFNDRYVTVVTVEFGSSDVDSSVNFLVKHRKLFAALKFLDPSLSITINDTTIKDPREFPMGTIYTDTFDVITD